MSNKTPIFPISDPQHFSDYGFDPQINYFQVPFNSLSLIQVYLTKKNSFFIIFYFQNQVLEEAMKHKRESSRSIDSIHFKLQKPISKEESRNKFHHTKSKKKRWWKNALFFFKRKWANHRDDPYDSNDIHQARAKAFRATISGPVYLTESRSGSTTPYRTTSRPSSGPLAGTLTPPAIGAVDIPYLSLRELTMEQQQQRMSTSAMPIYFVT
jgi:hypothetical protein